MPKILGITRSTLWNAWKNVRKQLSRSSLRDVSDFAEYDIDPDWWIGRLLKDLESGRYEPLSPHRYRMAKKMGFSRQMTLPNVPDIVLYRAIVDYLYKKAKKFEHEHVYFAQNTLSKKIREIESEGSFERGSDYSFTSGSAFAEWLKYDQYRKHLLLDKVYPFIVTTDITNFFDTVLYDRVLDAIQGISVDRGLVGLLLFILERLSIRDAFNESPRIGLPVEEFDCSRTLAHMVLFPHDKRMVQQVGEERYIRWMDDQNFGATSYSEGLNILKQCGESLARLHLTPNAAKSRILSLEEASRHFHFDINAELDTLEKAALSTPSERKHYRVALSRIWIESQRYEGVGEWGKILKRFYRLAGRGRLRLLRRRALDDIRSDPTLAGRVADYMRVVCSAKDYVDLVENVWNLPEQVYADVNQVFAEGLLKLKPTTVQDVRRIRQIAADLLSWKCDFPGWKRCATVAPLLILRYGDRRSLRLLRRVMVKLDNVPHPAIGKAVVAVYVSYGRAQFAEAVDAAAQLRQNYLAQFLRMIKESMNYSVVPARFKIRCEPVTDSVAGAKLIDMRKLITLRFLTLNNNRNVKAWVDNARRSMCAQDLSDFDKRLVNSLLKTPQKRRVGPGHRIAGSIKDKVLRTGT